MARIRGLGQTVWSEKTSGWFSASFGPFRRFRGGDREFDRLYFSHPTLAAHLSAFGEDVALSEALEWVKQTQFQALEKDSEASALRDSLIAFINKSQLLPHGARISEIGSRGVIIDDGEGAQVPVEEMSDGYRSILAMTFEIIRAMDFAFGTETLIDDLNLEPGTISLPGVILIDEVDAHLHPAWQSRIGNWFTDRFPNVQFFVTTHSPIICQAAERGSIWRLATPGSDQDSGRVTGREYDRLVFGSILDALSTDFFGTKVTRSAASDEKLERLAHLNQKSLYEKLSKSELSQQAELQRLLPSSSSDFSK